MIDDDFFYRMCLNIYISIEYCPLNTTGVSFDWGVFGWKDKYFDVDYIIGYLVIYIIYCLFLTEMADVLRVSPAAYTYTSTYYYYNISTNLCALILL